MSLLFSSLLDFKLLSVLKLFGALLSSLERRRGRFVSFCRFAPIQKLTTMNDVSATLPSSSFLLLSFCLVLRLSFSIVYIFSFYVIRRLSSIFSLWMTIRQLTSARFRLFSFLFASYFTPPPYICLIGYIGYDFISFAFVQFSPCLSFKLHLVICVGNLVVRAADRRPKPSGAPSSSRARNTKRSASARQPISVIVAFAVVDDFALFLPASAICILCILCIWACIYMKHAGNSRHTVST